MVGGYLFFFLNSSTWEENSSFFNHASVFRLSISDTLFLDHFRWPCWILWTNSSKGLISIWRFRKKFVVLTLWFTSEVSASKSLIKWQLELIFLICDWLHVAGNGFHKEDVLGVDSLSLFLLCMSQRYCWAIFHRVFDNSTVKFLLRWSREYWDYLVHFPAPSSKNKQKFLYFSKKHFPYIFG